MLNSTAEDFRKENIVEIIVHNVTNNRPKISVIIPIYNAAEYLIQSLNSLTAQTLKDIEIICVDDGSTDNSSDILKQYAQNDTRFKIIKQKNQGSAAARNTAIKYAMGEYIGFMDSDDCINETYFADLYKVAKKHDADISATDNVIVCEDNKQYKKHTGIKPKSKILRTSREKGAIIIASGISWNKIYKRSFLSKYDINCLEIKNPAEDNYFTDVAVCYAKKIAITHNAQYNYIIRNNSQTQKLKTRDDFKVFEIYKQIEDKIKSGDFSDGEKNEYLQTIKQRKIIDYNAFYNTMSKECKDDLKKLAIQDIGNKLIVSLTSYSARIDTVYIAIQSFLNQSLKPDNIILWLSEDDFPNKEKDLPDNLLNLSDTNINFSIYWCENIKSYKKLIPALDKFPQSVIITADDDLIYNHDCIKNLYKSHLKYPDSIISSRAHYILFDKNKKIKKYNKWINNIKYGSHSYNLMPTTGATVLFPPKTLYKDVNRTDIFMSICPSTDDLWFWAMAVVQGTKIRTCIKNHGNLSYIDGTQESGLWNTINSEGGNDIAMNNLLQHYPTLYKRLKKLPPIKKIMEKFFFIKRDNNRTTIVLFGLEIKLKNN